MQTFIQPHFAGSTILLIMALVPFLALVKRFSPTTIKVKTYTRPKPKKK